MQHLETILADVGIPIVSAPTTVNISDVSNRWHKVTVSRTDGIVKVTVSRPSGTNTRTTHPETKYSPLMYLAHRTIFFVFVVGSEID